ncbi:MAG TPA: hypothetical protein VJR48_13040, partial [Ktedonobacterales bacterium]|nr:hypothetical protein [Ktedonobacterales bacterium]
MSRTNRPTSQPSSRRRQRSQPATPDTLAMSDISAMSNGPISPGAGHTAPPADSRLAQLHHLYEVIADAGAALNIPPARLAEGEALERLEVVARLSVAQLAKCDGARAQQWFAALGDDLALDLRLDGLDPDMPAVAATLRAGVDPAGALQAF